MKTFEALERFVGLDTEFKLTKLWSKREGSAVDVGQYENGDFSLHIFPKTDKRPEQIAVCIQGRGFHFIRTSPVVGIIDQDENSTVFETEGGFYKLEKYSGM